MNVHRKPDEQISFKKTAAKKNSQPLKKSVGNNVLLHVLFYLRRPNFSINAR
jgi:hypothetical protein